MNSGNRYVRDRDVIFKIELKIFAKEKESPRPPPPPSSRTRARAFFFRRRENPRAGAARRGPSFRPREHRRTYVRTYIHTYTYKEITLKKCRRRSFRVFCRLPRRFAEGERRASARARRKSDGAGGKAFFVFFYFLWVLASGVGRRAACRRDPSRPGGETVVRE